MRYTRRRIAIISFSPIYRDSRVIRQIEYARKDFDVDVVGYGDWPYSWSSVRFFSVPRSSRSLIRNLGRAFFLVAGLIYAPFWEQTYWRKKENQLARDWLCLNDYRLIHANDLTALPLAVDVASEKKSKVIFDAHEFFLDKEGAFKHGSRIHLVYMRYLLNTYIHAVDKVITVSDGIAEAYKKELNIDVGVIMNAGRQYLFPPREVDSNDIRLIHHGIASPGRKLERLLRMMHFLDNRFSLYLLLADYPGDQTPVLKKIVRDERIPRVHFLDPVPPYEILDTISQFDIGVINIPSVWTSYKFALPNKFFDYISAGLMVVIGPSPEMEKMVRKYQLGIVADSFRAEDIAALLNRLSYDDISWMKNNSHLASKELNADIEMGKLMRIYHELID